jgi:hypothetical protein
MKTQLVILAAVIIVWIIAAVLLTQFGPQREADPIAAATRTPKPTFTATAKATSTDTASPTARPTQTPTSTPTATDTPEPTDTPAPTSTPMNTATPLPTSTPTTAPTSTPRPTSLPTEIPTPAPTCTPALPFTGSAVGGSPNCGTMGIWGYVNTSGGNPYPDVTVGVWSDAWEGRVSAPSEADGKYTVLLSDVPPGVYGVAVVDAGTCSTRDGMLTAKECNRLSEPIEVTLYEIYECESEGTVQWSEVLFTAQ